MDCKDFAPIFSSSPPPFDERPSFEDDFIQQEGSYEQDDITG